MKLAFDLHLHSCLSPCGSNESTPADLAGMCALAGLDIAALTDHNTCGNCRAFCEAAERYGLLALPGMELTGTVRNVIDFGVFVDIGVHQDGLVHISEVCSKRLRHPSEMVKVGDVVKVVVLSVDEKRKRISLSMKQAK